MGFMDALKAAGKELMKPESHIIGDKFENYILNLFAVSDKWILVKRTQDYTNNRQMYESNSLDPDFRLKHKDSNKVINLECKYRSSLNNGMLEWCKPYQLKRYKEGDKFSNTFIIIGFGGEPNSPERLFLLKLSDIKYEKFYLGYLKDFEIKVDCLFDLKNDKIIQLPLSESKKLVNNNKLEKIKRFLENIS